MISVTTKVILTTKEAIHSHHHEGELGHKQNDLVHWACDQSNFVVAEITFKVAVITYSVVKMTYNTFPEFTVSISKVRPFDMQHNSEYKPEWS